MSQISRYRAVLAVCGALSLGGIGLAVFLTKEPLDGSRGGVLAVGLALICILVKDDTAAKVYRALQEGSGDDVVEDSDCSVQVEKIKQRFVDLEKSFDEQAAEEKTMNKYLIGATILGTGAAAFGDIVSKWLICRLGM